MNIYQQINPLSDEQRIEAKQRAVAIVQKENGDAPSRDKFQNITVAKYPAWVNHLIIVLCAFVLIAAFVPSAIRLYAIGSQTFAQAIDDQASAMAAGLAVVIMAETAQILFSLAAAVLATTTPTSRRLLYASMAAATILALVGNAQVSLPGHWTNPFAYLEALLPPLLVLSTAYVLKEQMLHAIEQRHANERAYQEAYNAWANANGKPEAHPRYMSALANALRDALRESNAKGSGATVRRELMATFTNEHWKALVIRELSADEWYSSDNQTLPTPPALTAVQPAQAPEPQPKEELPAPPPRPFGNIATVSAWVDPAFTATTPNGNGHIVND